VVLRHETDKPSKVVAVESCEINAARCRDRLNEEVVSATTLLYHDYTSEEVDSK